MKPIRVFLKNGESYLYLKTRPDKVVLNHIDDLLRLEVIHDNIVENDDFYVSDANKKFNELCQMAGVCGSQVKSKEKRGKHLVMVRQVISYVMRSCGFSYSEIGDIMHRDHTSIIYNVDKVKEYVNAEDSDSEIKDLVYKLV